MDQDRYALWLIPSGTLYEETQKIIAQLAQEFSAPLFHPHVTLLGGISGRKDEIVSLCLKLAAVLKPFTVNLTSMSCLDDFYRCLFIQVEASEEISIANANAVTIFGQEATIPYFPHLSLLYGNHPPEVKESIIKRLGITPGREFFVDHFCLVSLAGGPQDWKIVKDFPILD